MAELENDSREKDFNLLTQSQNEFEMKNYEESLKILNQVELTNTDNNLKYRIEHNQHIVKFYIADSKNYKSLLEFLINHITNENINGKINNISTACYNAAVIYYHLGKPHAALEILNIIGHKFDDLDESICCRIGLLVLSLLLQLNQINKAVAFLKVLERQLKLNFESLNREENASIENINGADRMFRLMTLLTSILNKNFVTVPEDGSVEFAVLKAHNLYVGKDFQMAAKQLTKQFISNSFSIAKNGEDQDTVISNNMGVIHLRVRHYAIATRFFQNSIQFDSNIAKEFTNLPLKCLGASRMPDIMYNLGISLLHLQRPKDAFDCFLVPLKVYYKNPRLWLRVAESCIMFFEKKTNETEKTRIVSSVVGNGIHRKYILEPSPKIKFSEDGQSSAIPNPNLEFAALCLRNAVTLVENFKNSFKDPEDVSKSNESVEDIEDYNFCSPSSPITKESFDNLRAAIYAASSYVSIKLGDFVIALEYAKFLLELENLSDAYTMIGNLYCAESLVMLNRLVEARAHLEPKIVKNSNYFDFETRLWQLNSLEAAHAVIKYNLVVILVLQGEFDVAKALLNTFTHPVVMNKVKLLKMYIEVALGKL